ncbi:MAG: hypothetical protein JSW20_07760 [Nitrospiraceae bacterium]|nr:MAG: hypothetical protein JSW20_07760 [Nitrospiraceae bacterium]
MIIRVIGLVNNYKAFHPYHLLFLNISFLTIVTAFLIFGCGGGGGGGGGGSSLTPDTEAPSKPADVTAITVSTSRINITWSASTDNTGVSGYRIIQTAPLPEEELTTTPSTILSYNHINLSTNVYYCYNVSAFDAAGNESDRSSTTCTTTKLVATDASAGNQFGFSVAMHGDYAIIGAQVGDADGTVDTGAAYIYRRTASDTWDNGIKIVADDADPFDRFGWSASIYGDFAIVGAQFDNEGDNNAGAAYIFQRTGPDNTWDNGTKIMSQNPDANDHFGISVAISNEFAVIGATGDDDANTNSGAIYIFRNINNTWTPVTKILSPDAATDDFFGISVAISGNYVIAGATFADTTQTDTGAAYIFEWTGTSWGTGTNITPSNLNNRDFFGTAVSIDDNYAIVGARNNSDIEATAGAAYIFQNTGSNTWSPGVKITARTGDIDPGDNFGSSVAISEEYAIVGAESDDDQITNAGAAYVFRKTGSGNTWDSGTKINASDFETDALFGNAVAIEGSRAIVGSLLKDDGKSNSGAAYIFDVPPM